MGKSEIRNGRLSGVPKPTGGFARLSIGKVEVEEPMLFMGDEFLQTGFWHCGDNKHEWMQVREFVCDASSATRRGCSYGWNLKRMRRRHGECIRKIKQSQGMGNLCPNRQEYISTRSVRSVRSLAPFTETLWCELMWI